MILLIMHWVFLLEANSMVQIVLQMTQEMVKYIGFYYCVYFFTAQAVEILSNKDNDFIYYTKLGLISTSIIQIVHCLVTLILISISKHDNNKKNIHHKDYYRENFCHNNLWVMMRFLGLAVTLGFIFIGWRIQQSILNPLISKKKRQSIMNRMKKKNEFTVKGKEKFIESRVSDNKHSDMSHSDNTDEKYSYISDLKDRMGSDASDSIEHKIKMKK